MTDFTASTSGESEIERTLCQLPEVYVFKIPVRSSAEGYRAADWPKEHMWTGKVKIVAKGNTAYIFLLGADDKVFALCPVTDDNAVERTVDSGRYFVLRIQNAEGKHAYIGIAFNERNYAFDFNVTLSEHKESLERESKASELHYNNNLSNISLQPGQKIHINVNATKKTGQKPTKTGGLLKGGLLAPPPRDKHVKPIPSARSPTLGGAGGGVTQQDHLDLLSGGLMGDTSMNNSSAGNSALINNSTGITQNSGGDDGFSSSSDGFESNNADFDAGGMSDPFASTSTTTTTAPSMASASATNAFDDFAPSEGNTDSSGGTSSGAGFSDFDDFTASSNTTTTATNSNNSAGLSDFDGLSLANNSTSVPVMNPASPSADKFAGNVLLSPSNSNTTNNAMMMPSSGMETKPDPFAVLSSVGSASPNMNFNNNFTPQSSSGQGADPFSGLGLANNGGGNPSSTGFSPSPNTRSGAPLNSMMNNQSPMNNNMNMSPMGMTGGPGMQGYGNGFSLSPNNNNGDTSMMMGSGGMMNAQSPNNMFPNNNGVFPSNSGIPNNNGGNLF